MLENETENIELEDVQTLREKMRLLTVEFARINKMFGELQRKLDLQECAKQASETNANNAVTSARTLSSADICNYSRQLILPGFGVAGQQKLKSTSFLIVGMGGLGCPAAQYLIMAGVERMGIVDYDEVELNNLHRQGLHTAARVGMQKVDSARLALQELNSQCKVEAHNLALNRNNAMSLIENYDIILDCSDNVATRYLLNDACVFANKPLVSGSAIQLDGQLTVYHYGDTGPCYRCLFPVPPPPEAVTNCGDGGVLGAVTGIIGSAQALEAIKIAVGLGEVLAGRLLIFDGARGLFRNVKLRARRSNCEVCSSNAIVNTLIDYEHFCGAAATDKNHTLHVLTRDERISAVTLASRMQEPHLLIDVRPENEFEICQLSQSVNMPIKSLLNDKFDEQLKQHAVKHNEIPVYVVCRRGNDSQLAVQHLRLKHPTLQLFDIIGGLHSWHDDVDVDFPKY